MLETYNIHQIKAKTSAVVEEIQAAHDSVVPEWSDSVGRSFCGVHSRYRELDAQLDSLIYPVDQAVGNANYYYQVESEEAKIANIEAEADAVCSLR